MATNERKLPATGPSTRPFENNEEIVKYLLKGNNLTEFIKHFNNCSKGDRQLRLEKYRPSIYMIVVNDPYFQINGERLKLVKVGFTHSDTTQETNNRMETVKKEITRNLEAQEELKESKVSVSILGVFAIDALNLDSFFDIEKQVREKIGFCLSKDIPNKLSLPVTTEWILTKQEHIDTINKKKEAVLAKKERLTTEMFDGLLKSQQNFLLHKALKLSEKELEEEVKKLSKESYIKKPAPKEAASESSGGDTTPKEQKTTAEESAAVNSSSSATTQKEQKTAVKKKAKPKS